MINILFAVAITAASSNAIATPPRPVTRCGTTQTICKRKIVPAKLRLLKTIPVLSSKDIDETDYSDDDEDDITIQSITRIREVKHRDIDDLDEETAERLSMIKWIVLARLANPNLHKA